MLNITGYSDSELYDHFQNDEGLYNEWNRTVWRNDRDSVKGLCDGRFVYSEAQMENLMDEWDRERDEYLQEQQEKQYDDSEDAGEDYDNGYSHAEQTFADRSDYAGEMVRAGRWDREQADEFRAGA